MQAGQAEPAATTNDKTWPWEAYFNCSRHEAGWRRPRRRSRRADERGAADHGAGQGPATPLEAALTRTEAADAGRLFQVDLSTNGGEERTARNWCELRPIRNVLVEPVEQPNCRVNLMPEPAGGRSGAGRV